jgi:hypothetical protein
MKKYILIIVALCFCICSCTIESNYCRVYARNISNVSGATLRLGPEEDGVWIAGVYYLPPCPITGIPVEKNSINYLRKDKQQMRWEVEKEMDSTTIDSGTFTMEDDKWLEVDGTNGDWTCTWSNEPWQ